MHCMRKNFKLCITILKYLNKSTLGLCTNGMCVLNECTQTNTRFICQIMTKHIHRSIMLEYIVTIGNIMYNTYWDEISEKIGANVTLCGDQAA